jgi:hypothetical protein
MTNGNYQSHANKWQWLGTGVLAALGAGFLWSGFENLPLGTLDDPGPGAAPVLLAGLLIVCALWNQIGGGAALLDVEEGEEASSEPGALRHAFSLFAATILVAFALDPLGYRLTILALLLFFVGFVERKPVVTVLLLSFGLSFGSYWIFDHVLKVPLPVGPFGI